MPKKRVTAPDADSEAADDPRPLHGWQASGTSLAVASTAVLGGLATLLGAILLAPVVHAMARLRAASPGASTIGDLVAATLGRRVGAFTTTVQTFGFAMLAAAAAQSAGLLLATPLTPDVDTLSTSWLWPLMSVTALALFVVLVLAVPDRIVAGAIAVLAAVGLLVVFYLALAVIANALTRGPIDLVAADPPTGGLAVAGTMAMIVTTLVGFDVVTTRTAEMRSLARPVGIALGATAALAVLVWYAVHVSDPKRFRWDAHVFNELVLQMYPDAGLVSLNVASICLGVAVLMALLWAITRQILRTPSSEIELFVVTALVAVLAVARTRDWSGALQATSFIGAVLLFVVYAVAIEASARIGDSTATWWARIVTPVALVAVVLLPVIQGRFSAAALQALAIAAILAATAAAFSRIRPR